MKIISTPNAPAAIGPYSQAITHGKLVFASGQIALKADGSFVGSGIVDQTKQVLANLKAVLEASGSGVDKVLKTTLFLVDMNDFTLVNSLYEEFFGSHKPARSTVAVKQLPRNAMVELEAIAAIA
ncbi:MAG: RidA family protein [Helicobacteraceae bacterium]|jgi:2-iminobutanoate/2-iminopropanoate deaminase|nr:RidA family protein [Helicobacteraceae bacterium]